jgi:hypothetical protein
MTVLAALAVANATLTADLSAPKPGAGWIQSVIEVAYNVAPEIRNAQSVVEVLYTIQPPTRVAATTIEVVTGWGPPIKWPASVYEVIYTPGVPIPEFGKLSASLAATASFVVDLAVQPLSPPISYCEPCPPNRWFSFGASVYIPPSAFESAECELPAPVSERNLAAVLVAEATLAEIIESGGNVSLEALLSASSGAQVSE